MRLGWEFGPTVEINILLKENTDKIKKVCRRVLQQGFALNHCVTNPDEPGTWGSHISSAECITYGFLGTILLTVNLKC